MKPFNQLKISEIEDPKTYASELMKKKMYTKTKT